MAGFAMGQRRMWNDCAISDKPQPKPREPEFDPSRACCFNGVLKNKH